MKIGVIGAMEAEVASLKENMPDSEVTKIGAMEFYEGKIGNTETVVVRSGVGKVHAAICTQILIDLFHVTHVLNTGIAGSLNDAIHIGDVVISTDAVQHDFRIEGFGYQPGQIPGIGQVSFPADETLREKAGDVISRKLPEISVFEGRVASGDQFINDTARKKWIRETFHAECTEMEGAAIAQAAYVNHIPYLIIRYISDHADDAVEYADFEELAARNSAKILLTMLEEM